MEAAQFVILSHVMVCPSIIYLLYHLQWFHALQIGCNAVFSLFYHFPALTGEEWRPIFSFMDEYVSYLSIYVFSVYFFLKAAPSRLCIEFYLTQQILLLVVLRSIDYTLLISTILGCTLSTILLRFYELREIYLWNPYVWLTLLMAGGDLTCFILALHGNYSLFHSIHHFLAFTLPLSIECAVSWKLVDLEGL
jgi:hypothetical protein